MSKNITFTETLQKEALGRCKNLEYIPKDVFLHELTTAISETIQKTLEEVRKEIEKKRLIHLDKGEVFALGDDWTVGHDDGIDEGLEALSTLTDTHE